MEIHGPLFHGKINYMTPIIYTDYYKTEHYRMYPEGTVYILDNMTARKSRLKGVDSIIVFGPQHFMLKYLVGKFVTEFFRKSWEEVEEEYKYAINTDTSHIKALHELGYLPLLIRCLPEGARCPIRVPFMTVENTLPEFYWLPNYLETLISCSLWQPITSATIAAEYRKILSKHALETTGSDDFVQWQAHDFSMRGMSSLESSILSGMGHLTSFTGTDTIPAIYALRNSYKGTGLIGGSVPATEHSVMCMGTKEDEIATFERLLDLYPTGILSVVSDTWNLWKVLTEYMPALKDKILARDGKLVIRPDSGDPVDIICGKLPLTFGSDKDASGKVISPEEQKGVIELLWDVFGGKINSYGFKELDPHVGAIYGDSITLERADQICRRLRAKGFASTNIVFGVGSYTYQYNTRDTFGFAVKATYGEVELIADEDMSSQGGPYLGEQVLDKRMIYKDPVTDDGTKKSAKGLLFVGWDADKKTYYLKDQVSKEEFESSDNQLQPVFKDGMILTLWTLDEIRQRIRS
jgi:nicotinamide phosphoribosyltransferase